MEIKAESRGDTLQIYAKGDLDEHTASTARRIADDYIQKFASQSAAKRVVFYLREVTFKDSAAIGFLLGRYKTCNRVRLQAFVAEPTAEADKILQIGGVYTLMPKIRLV